MSLVKNIIVFGAHGKVGQNLIRLLSAKTSPYTATAVVRNSDQASKIAEISSNSPKVSTALLSIDSANVSDIADAIHGHDAVVFTAGSGGKNLLQVDLDGAVKTFEASVISNVKRYVLVSAIYADNRDLFEKSPIRNYYIAKHYADRILQAEFKDELDYTILKPSRLTDEPGTGKIKILEADDEAGDVTREDVAKVIYEVLNNKLTVHRSYDFNNGESSISDADTFR
ncbi:uncharacterized protein RJT20DRAFT_40333 [Scheffersomyces xylosifermentans]|uniref:uncharacterized protein n=1 Tax=Scheffersomyces xylosifermentans TaxID=1304137 RepID=UPI00315DF984